MTHHTHDRRRRRPPGVSLLLAAALAVAALPHVDAQAASPSLAASATPSSPPASTPTRTPCPDGMYSDKFAGYACALCGIGEITGLVPGGPRCVCPPGYYSFDTGKCEFADDLFLQVADNPMHALTTRFSKAFYNYTSNRVILQTYTRTPFVGDAAVSSPAWSPSTRLFLVYAYDRREWSLATDIGDPVGSRIAYFKTSNMGIPYATALDFWSKIDATGSDTGAGFVSTPAVVHPFAQYPSMTPTVTPSITPSTSASATTSASVSMTPTATVSVTVTVTATTTRTVSATMSISRTVSPSRSVSPTKPWTATPLPSWDYTRQDEYWNVTANVTLVAFSAVGDPSKIRDPSILLALRDSLARLWGMNILLVEAVVSTTYTAAFPSASPSVSPSVTPTVSLVRVSRTPGWMRTPSVTPSGTPTPSLLWDASVSPSVTPTSTITSTRTPVLNLAEAVGLSQAFLEETEWMWRSGAFAWPSPDPSSTPSAVREMTIVTFRVSVVSSPSFNLTTALAELRGLTHDKVPSLVTVFSTLTRTVTSQIRLYFNPASVTAVQRALPSRQPTPTPSNSLLPTLQYLRPDLYHVIVFNFTVSGATAATLLDRAVQRAFAGELGNLFTVPARMVGLTIVDPGWAGWRGGGGAALQPSLVARATDIVYRQLLRSGNGGASIVVEDESEDAPPLPFNPSGLGWGSDDDAALRERQARRALADAPVHGAGARRGVPAAAWDAHLLELQRQHTASPSPSRSAEADALGDGADEAEEKRGEDVSGSGAGARRLAGASGGEEWGWLSPVPPPPVPRGLAAGTPTITANYTVAPTRTGSPTQSRTRSVTKTPTITSMPSPSSSPSGTPSKTATPLRIGSATSTPSSSSSASPSQTLPVGGSDVPSAAASATLGSLSPSPTPSVSPSPSESLALAAGGLYVPPIARSPTPSRSPVSPTPTSTATVEFPRNMSLLVLVGASPERNATVLLDVIGRVLTTPGMVDHLSDVLATVMIEAGYRVENALPEQPVLRFDPSIPFRVRRWHLPTPEPDYRKFIPPPPYDQIYGDLTRRTLAIVVGAIIFTCACGGIVWYYACCFQRGKVGPGPVPMKVRLAAIESVEVMAEKAVAASLAKMGIEPTTAFAPPAAAVPSKSKRLEALEDDGRASGLDTVNLITDGSVSAAPASVSGSPRGLITIRASTRGVDPFSVGGMPPPPPPASPPPAHLLLATGSVSSPVISPSKVDTARARAPSTASSSVLLPGFADDGTGVLRTGPIRFPSSNNPSGNVASPRSPAAGRGAVASPAGPSGAAGAAASAPGGGLALSPPPSSARTRGPRSALALAGAATTGGGGGAGSPYPLPLTLASPAGAGVLASPGGGGAAATRAAAVSASSFVAGPTPGPTSVATLSPRRGPQLA